MLTFTSGAIATVLMSFDVWNHELPHIELYGTRGTLSVPDPDKYDGAVRLRLHADRQWGTVAPVIAPLTTRPGALLRGPGVADLAAALSGQPQRCTAEFALHVLEVLETISKGEGIRRTMTTTCSRPPAVPRADAQGR